jgi:hypothetical protein
MHDDENDNTFNRSDCVPTFFAIRDPLYKRHAAGIVENELCCFKVDTVLRLVNFVFRPIPFDPHAYLQYSTYDCVKARSRAAKAREVVVLERHAPAARTRRLVEIYGRLAR